MGHFGMGVSTLAIAGEWGGAARRARASRWIGTWLTAVAVLVCLMGGLAVGVKGQEIASINGTVTDKTGAPISAADVTLTDTRTGAVYQSKTGSYGAYLFSRVAPGPGYTLTVSKDNFKTFTVANLYLAVATTRTQDVVLEIGSISQKVEVTSQGSVSLDTTDTTIGNNFDVRHYS